MKALKIFMAALVTLVAAAAQADRYVSLDGDDDKNDGKSWKSPFRTVAKAITTTTSYGEYIYVSNGVYHLTEPVVFTGVQGAGRNGTVICGWTGDPRDVVFDCDGKTNAFTYTGGYYYAFKHLTVQNCISKDNGAGINNTTYGQIVHCIISNCISTAGSGGGIKTGNDGYVTDTLIVDCSAVSGGGAYLYRSWMRGCTITNCSAKTLGGGLYVTYNKSWSDAEPTYVTNTTVTCCRLYAENSDMYGGGVYIQCDNNCNFRPYMADCIVENCILSNKVSNTSIYKHRGGGVYLDGTDIYNSRVSGCKLYSDGTGYYERADGGGISAATRYPIISGCTVCSNATYHLMSQAKGDGGGISLIEPGLVTNCLIFGNHTCFGGSGVRIKGASKLVDCTITDNWVTNYLYTGSSFGGAVRVSGDTGAVVERCLIAGNHDAKKGVYNGNGAALLLSGTDTIVRDCIISNNTSAADSDYTASVVRFGATSHGTAEDNVISNCYFVGNKGWSPMFASYSTKGQMLITDCVFRDNTMGSCLILQQDHSSKDITFRNTFFVGNRATRNTSYGIAGDNYSLTYPESTIHLDYCTFVSNKVGKQLLYARYNGDRTLNTATNNHVTGCLFYGNSSGDFDNAMRTIAPQNITYTRSTDLTTSAEYHTYGGEVSPGFRGADHGDCRLTRDSALVDAGAKEDWMGDGVLEGGPRKGGPRDLGTGWPEIKASADYGVTLTWKRNMPRLFNGKPDIGCFEYFKPRGAAIFVK